MPNSFTVNKIKGLKPKDRQYEVFENSERRGAGRLGIRIQRSGGKMFIFRYFIEGGRKYITLGRFGDAPSSLSLMDARLRADELSSIVLNGQDPKVVIEDQRKAAEKNAQQLSARGTLEQLLETYLARMESSGKRSYKEVEKAFFKEVFTMIDRARPASDIETAEFVEVLAVMIERGASTQSNRVRSYLHAAYELGLKLDNDPRHTKSGVKFGIKYNPIRTIPRQKDAERALTRFLSFDELEYVFENLQYARRVGYQMTLLLKLCLFLGGQRPYEVLNTPWSSIDLEKREFVIPAEVSKNGRAHLVPLCDSSIEILVSLKQINPTAVYTTRSSRKNFLPVRTDSLATAVKRFTEKDHNINHFTPRDLRRTCKTLMGTLRISKFDRDKLQNHTINDVSSRHYDLYDYYEEKKTAIMTWEKKLKTHIKTKALTH